MSGWLSLVWVAITAAAGGGEIVVVRPNGWSETIQPWKAFRESEGFQVVELEPQSTAKATLASVRTALQNLPSRSSAASIPTIVLMGDAVPLGMRDVDARDLDRVATFYVDSEVVHRFGSEPTIATDQPYSDWTADGIAEAVVGRIPAESREQLQRYLERVVRFEKRDHHSSSRELDIVAGVGDFGPVVDTVIEGVTRQLLINDLPEAYTLSMTQASPGSLYCPAPEKFCDSVIERINDGGLFWVYLGHGFVDTLDHLKFTRPPRPILDKHTVHRIAVTEHPPIAVMLACYVGAFDAGFPSLAEQMLLEVDGPIAVVAASRVTMPYAMGIFGDELLQQCFGQRKDRLGAIFASAKSLLAASNSESSLTGSNVVSTETKTSREASGTSSTATVASVAGKRELMDSMAKALSPEGHSLEKERREHLFLFNLLGDPLVSVRHPKKIDFEVPESIVADQPIVIRGFAATAGKLKVELAYRRTRVPDRVKELRSRPTTAGSESNKQLVYEAANRLTVTSLDREHGSGPFELVIPADPKRRGVYQVHVFLENGSGWSTGTRTVRIEPNTSAR